MSNRDEMNRNLDSSRRDLDRASQDLGRAADHTGDALHHTKEALEAGASATIDGAKEVASTTARAAGKVAQGVRNAEINTTVEGRVSGGTAKVLDTTANAVRGAAPVVGRGVEATLKATGTALHAVGGPLGWITGKIAGTVGGWWNSASEAVAELPETDEQACRIHFEAYAVRPSGMTWDTARTAYTIGYIAAANPAYSGRGFDDVEPDLRHGFDEETSGVYDSLRDFARYGYERRTTPPFPSTDPSSVR
ncbi:MAG: hypothetical protein H0X65_09375 [Gemmatimonadetes bacterium]|nr:hypothetical protein [Gemmatimonadota bacterium]